MSRLENLVGKAGKSLAYKHLPEEHQLAIAYYMSVNGDAWEALYDQDAADVSAALEAALPLYVSKYGMEEWQACSLPVQRVINAVMQDEEIAESFRDWQEYAKWYLGATDVPNYPTERRWPVVLSSDSYETIRDGWHRFHSYVRSGCHDIPAVF